MPRRFVIGCWSAGLYPHPRQLLGDGVSAAEREQLVSYLARCPVRRRGQVPLLIGPAYVEGIVGGPHARTDGTWVFPVSLPEYVRRGLRLPAEFVDHVRSRGYVCPDGVVDDPNEPEDAGFWILWSLSHSRVNRWHLWHLVRFALFGGPLLWLTRHRPPGSRRPE